MIQIAVEATTDVKLSGPHVSFTEVVREKVEAGDFDELFDELTEKYAGETKLPPEIELPWMLLQSAMQFHRENKAGDDAAPTEAGK